MFLQRQEDNISDEEAIKRYNEYKLDFRKTQLNNFFLEHKEEEWFKSRYHPDECYKRRNEQNQCVLNRLDVFMSLMETSLFEKASAEMEKSKDLIKFLDAVVIKLEGGSDQDLKYLDDTSSSSSDDAKPNEEEKASKSNLKEDEKKPTTNGKGDNEDDLENEAAQDRDRDREGKKKNGDERSDNESGAYTDSDSDTDDRKKKKSTNHKQEASANETSNKNRQLHRTASIFMRNLAPSVTKQDLEFLCKTYDGFKRIALSDPAPERGFYRRGWITFEPHIDVKKICWSLQSIKLKECNPGAIVNRELTNRIRPITHLLTHHKAVVKNDIKLAMKIVQNMDRRWNLWQEGGTVSEASESTTSKEEASKTISDKENKDQEGGVDTGSLEEEAFKKSVQVGPLYLSHKYNGMNPLLVNITDYLVDETNAEEEELLGDNQNKTDSNPNNSKSERSSTKSLDIEMDKNYTKMLDKLILYLRVVHSIDFYNSIEYQQEDSMPNRCGIMFVRPGLPANAASASLKINQDEMQQYTQSFEQKMKPYVDYKEKLDLDAAKKLGFKDRREEIEKFIKANTQELAPDRWLCPLSGKKFKGPEFIRKHLFYKHIEKINEVIKEVEYYNSYVLDIKRPQLPEHPSNRQPQPGAASVPSVPNSSASTGNQLQSFLTATSSPTSLSHPSSYNQMPGQSMHLNVLFFKFLFFFLLLLKIINNE
jgi:hypothetical protein